MNPMVGFISKNSIQFYLIYILISQTGDDRIILKWGRYPKDLDLHLALWPLSGLNSCEVFYNNPKCPGANLDVDSANGGLAGPETITIKSYQGNIYKLCLKADKIS